MASGYNYTVQVANNNRKTVADPNYKYESLVPTWKKIKAVVGGQDVVKEYDKTLRSDGTNLLIPFSSSMTPVQYNFYKSESELPGMVAQFAKTVVGGMLRKQVSIDLKEDTSGIPEDAIDWVRNRFTSDNRSMLAFLDDALWEEMQTSRAWVCVNYPENPTDSTYDGGPPEPFPILISGESVINWLTGVHPVTGEDTLVRVIIRMYVQDYDQNEFHPNWVDTVWVHELDEQGYYQIRTYQRSDPTSDSAGVVNGQVQQDYATSTSQQFVQVDQETNITQAGERLDFIPLFPLNGQVEPMEPILATFVDREVGLYNRISRRNHLLYGASTYTPVLKSNLTDDEKEDVVGAGLGSWLFLERDDDIDILQTPSDALTSYESAIAATIDEMARMGMRMLAPDAAQADSGVALEIRNAGQTAQLSALARMVSQSLRRIITTMINWRYDLEILEDDIEVTLSTDLTPVPLGEEYMRLVSEWYTGGLLPRSTFLEILKMNDILPADFNDEEAMEEMANDELVMSPAEQNAQEMEMQQAQMDQDADMAEAAIAASNSGDK